MTEHNPARRSFLFQALVGAGAFASANAEVATHAVAAPGQDPNPSTHDQAHSEGIGAFFNRDDAAAVGAIADVLMPAAPGKPGARDAGVLNYIDLALAGAYADLQDFYRNGLRQLDQYCHDMYRQSFVSLSPAQQQAVMTALEEGKATGFTWPSAQGFFETVRTHTMEGMFADPIYGGNKDFAGWRLVGFPGPQPIFTSTDMQSKEVFTRAPIVGLQGQVKRP
jgi:gluconate 2-dehydrogenase gamma chain